VEAAVQAGDTTADLNYPATGSLRLNGGTIKDAAGNTASLALPATGSAESLAGQKNLVIDASPVNTLPALMTAQSGVATTDTAGSPSTWSAARRLFPYDSTR
jgi:hypothetical protein